MPEEPNAEVKVLFRPMNHTDRCIVLHKVLHTCGIFRSNSWEFTPTWKLAVRIQLQSGGMGNYLVTMDHLQRHWQPGHSLGCAQCLDSEQAFAQ